MSHCYNCWKIWLLRLFEAIALDIHGNKEVLAIHSADDVARLLKERTNLTYDISVHKQDKTDQIRRSIGKLSSLVGALKIHEILIDQNLVVKKKNLPNDPFYKSVLIKESRRKSTISISNDSDSGSEFDDIDDSDDWIHLNTSYHNIIWKPWHIIIIIIEGYKTGSGNIFGRHVLGMKKCNSVTWWWNRAFSNFPGHWGPIYG